MNMQRLCIWLGTGDNGIGVAMIALSPLVAAIVIGMVGA